MRDAHEFDKVSIQLYALKRMMGSGVMWARGCYMFNNIFRNKGYDLDHGGGHVLNSGFHHVRPELNLIRSNAEFFTRAVIDYAISHNDKLPANFLSRILITTDCEKLRHKIESRYLENTIKTDCSSVVLSDADAYEIKSSLLPASDDHNEETVCSLRKILGFWI